MENEQDDIDRGAYGAGDPSTEVSADQSPSGVGYKRPPVNTRFRKGESGNRKGRPKGSRNLRALFERLMQETVRVRDGDKTRRISTSDALSHVLLRGATRVEPGAIRVQMYVEEHTGLLDPPQEEDGKRCGYLVVPMKLPPEEWQKRADRALEHNLDPPRLPVVTCAVD
jgi:hypothetical protein